METEIIDSGIGISEERQKLLFLPFQELKAKQDQKQVKDHNIGMGLTCSKAIAREMGGDIILKSSKRGLTSMAFKIPIKAELFYKDEEMKTHDNKSIQITKKNTFHQSKTFSNINLSKIQLSNELKEHIKDLDIDSC